MTLSTTSFFHLDDLLEIVATAIKPWQIHVTVVVHFIHSEFCSKGTQMNAAFNTLAVEISFLSTKSEKRNCKSVKKEKLKFGSTQMKVYFGIPYKKCKQSWWWRLLPGGLGWSPVATSTCTWHPRPNRATLERCHVQRTVAGKPTTWSWFGVPRWCTWCFGKGPGFVQESMDSSFPRFSMVCS